MPGIDPKLSSAVSTDSDKSCPDFDYAVEEFRLWDSLVCGLGLAGSSLSECAERSRSALRFQVLWLLCSTIYIWDLEWT